MKRRQHGGCAARQSGAGGPGIHLEIVSQRKLQAPGIARGEDLAKERPEIGVRTRNAPVGVIEGVERLGTKLNRLPLMNPESPFQGEVEEIISRTGKRVPSRVPERIRSRRGECIGIKKLVVVPQAAR